MQVSTLPKEYEDSQCRQADEPLHFEPQLRYAPLRGKGSSYQHGIELQVRPSMIKTGPYNPGLSDREEHPNVSLNHLSVKIQVDHFA